MAEWLLFSTSDHKVLGSNPAEGITDCIMLHCTEPFSWLRWFSWMRIQLVIGRLRVRPPLGRQHSFVEIDHEIFSTVILSLSLIQEGQLSVSGKRICTILVNHLED